MAHHAHIRVTPYDLDYDLSGVIANAEKYIVVSETGKQTLKPHFHIWLITDVCKATINNHVKRYFKVPPGKRGHESKYYSCYYDTYKDPSPEYICKELDYTDSEFKGLECYHGYTPEEIEQFMIDGKRKYGPGSEYFRKKHPELHWKEKAANSIPAESEDPKSEPALSKHTPKDEWKRLSEGFEEFYYPNKKSLNMPDIARWIKHYYLARFRPIPRTGDLRRYSYSLWAIYVKDDTSMEGVDAADSHEATWFGVPGT